MDVELLNRVRNGDDEAFVMLVGRYQLSMLRLARSMVPSHAVAEETVQDTWMGVVRGLERFEGRSSFKTWLFRILINRARTKGVKEKRVIPVDLTSDRSLLAGRFNESGMWADPPIPFTDSID